MIYKLRENIKCAVCGKRTTREIKEDYLSYYICPKCKKEGYRGSEGINDV